MTPRSAEVHALATSYRGAASSDREVHGGTAIAPQTQTVHPRCFVRALATGSAKKPVPEDNSEQAS